MSCCHQSHLIIKLYKQVRHSKTERNLVVSLRMIRWLKSWQIIKSTPILPQKRRIRMAEQVSRQPWIRIYKGQLMSQLTFHPKLMTSSTNRTWRVNKNATGRRWKVQQVPWFWMPKGRKYLNNNLLQLKLIRQRLKKWRRLLNKIRQPRQTNHHRLISRLLCHQQKPKFKLNPKTYQLRPQ